MSIKSSIHTYLSTHQQISAALGNDPSRVEPVALSQTTIRPAITYRRMPSDHDHNLRGATGTSLATFRLTSWGDTFKAADELSELVRSAMQGFGGLFGGTRIDSVTLINDFDDFSQPQSGQGNASFMVHHDYHIRYGESVPQFSQ